jgi:hypothetical protein
MVDRRKRLQEILDGIEKGWVVVEPTAQADESNWCLFQKPDERKEASAGVPRQWFDDGEDDRIMRTIRAALSNAVVKS